ncbi:DNA-binding transcriptional MerR regulator [Streptacidiphilus sp. MAP12-16]|jgi:DNA-binding transcriptional MerR regulator|uniref:MerR family transcriptional regulator n=1 Tax=Streptacidiphilus sp. MAP12-16 TaxID=3156300 RepID=UPI00351182DB
MELWTIGTFAAASRLSPKALRLYDELELLVPARTDPASGYRLYSPEQLERARLVAWLRRLGMPLARIRSVCDLEPDAAAKAVAAYWAEAEAEQGQRRELAHFLIEKLSGRTVAMFQVATREVGQRTLLCALRHVTVAEIGEFSTSMVLRLGDGSVPGVRGLEGAPFMVYHGEVDADSDGPVEWCRPVPAEAADELAARYPDLTIRQDPAHREAYVRLNNDQLARADGLRAFESLQAWFAEHGVTPSGPPRQTFFADPREVAADIPVSDVIGPLPPVA